MDRPRRGLNAPERLEQRLAPALLLPSDPGFAGQWGLHNTGQFGGVPGVDIGAALAWQVTTGSRQIVVAVIDSGIDLDHPDLAANLWSNPGEIPDNGLDDDGNGFVDDVHGWDFVGNDPLPDDGFGHGTHVAGVIGAVGGDGVGVTGVAWQVSIMVLRVLDDRGGGSSTAAAAAIDYATRMRREYGIEVVAANLSWVLPGAMSPAVDAAVRQAGDAGITVVAAAGNFASDNDLTPRFPASSELPNVIAVAALDNTGQLAPMSNWGATSVDIAAPGTLVLSTQIGGGRGQMSGTSMAAPFVTGAVALLAAARPGISLAEVRTAILDGAVRMPALVGRVATGGRLDLPGALAAAGIPLPRPPAEVRLGSVQIDVTRVARHAFTIEVTARFSGPVAVWGTPAVPVFLKQKMRLVPYAGGAEGDTLSFRLVVSRRMPRSVGLGSSLVLKPGAGLASVLGSAMGTSLRGVVPSVRLVDAWSG